MEESAAPEPTEEEIDRTSVGPRSRKANDPVEETLAKPPSGAAPDATVHKSQGSGGGGSDDTAGGAVDATIPRTPRTDERGDPEATISRDVAGMRDRAEATRARRPFDESREKTAMRGAAVAPEDVARQDPLVGVQLGDCILREKVGAGAMGVVYKATQTGFDRTVAVKIIRPELCADEDLVQQFLTEAKAVGKFQGPNVVQVHRIGYEKGLHYLVMEFIEGGSLKEYAKAQEKHRLLVNEALNFILQAAKGLEEAERLGIIHRDIKPDNLLLDHKKTIKIADFGISKILGSDIGRTQEGEVKGTPLYMSPEQCKGEVLDTRSDIYSLGATFFHLLTGKKPADGKTLFEVTRQKTETPYLSLRESLPSADAPEHVSRIIEKMTAQELVDRYANIKDLMDDVRRVIAGSEPEAEKPPERRPPPPPKRSPWKAVAAVLVIACVGVFAPPWRTHVIQGFRQLFDPRPPVPPNGKEKEQDLVLAGFRGRLTGLREEARTVDPFVLLPRIETLESDLSGKKYTTEEAACKKLLADIEKAASESVRKQLEQAQERMKAGEDPTSLLEALRGKVQVSRRLKAHEATIATLLADHTRRTLDAQLDKTRSEFNAGEPLPALLVTAQRLQEEISKPGIAEQTILEKAKRLVNDINRAKEVKDLLDSPVPGAVVPFSGLLTDLEQRGRVLDKAKEDCPLLESWIERAREGMKTPLLDACRGAIKTYLDERRREHANKAAEPTALIASLGKTIGDIETAMENLARVFPDDSTLSKMLSEALDPLKTQRGGALSMTEKTGRAQAATKDLAKKTSELSRLRDFELLDPLETYRRLSTRDDLFFDPKDASFSRRHTDIKEKSDAWERQRVRVIRVLDLVAARKLADAVKGIGAAADALKQDAIDDKDLATLQGAIEHIDRGFDLATETLDLDKAAKEHFVVAAEALRGFAENLDAAHPLAKAAQSAAAYAGACAREVRALKEAVRGMARIPTGEIESRRIPGFFLDSRETSRAEFLEFLEKTPNLPLGMVRLRTTLRMDKEAERRKAIDVLTYSEAEAFARYRGRQIMTLDQWKRAAGQPARRFCWGNNWAEGAEFQRNQLGDAAAGGSHPAPGSGDPIFNLAGNAGEFVRKDANGHTYVAGGSYKDVRDRLKEDYFRSEKLPNARVPRGGVRTSLTPEESLAGILPLQRIK